MFTSRKFPLFREIVLKFRFRENNSNINAFEIYRNVGYCCCYLKLGAGSAPDLKTIPIKNETVTCKQEVCKKKKKKKK